MTPEVCPNCGAEVPLGAKACPECGADEQTGWSEKARYDNLNLPGKDFDYNDFVKREFDKEREKVVPHGVHSFWWIIAILVIAALVYLWVL